MTTSGPGATGGGAAGGVLPLARVGELLVTLGKALRAAQLYDTNNPVYKRFVEALISAYAELWSELDALSLTVDEELLRLEGEEVYRNAGRSESLAFLLYKDGIRLITFTPGFEREVPRFLEVLNRARHARRDDDDLLTLLWEADLESFTYRYIDLLAEGVALPEAGDGAESSELQAALEEMQEGGSEADESGGEPPPETVRPDDFNPTLYSLDASEMKELRAEIRREMERDLRGEVLKALFDRIEEPKAERRREIFHILEGLLPAFLARGEMGAAVRVLEELRRLEAAEIFEEEEQRRLTALLDRVSAPETIEEIVGALELGAIAPSPRELGTFLGFLRGGALGSLLRATERTESRDLQRVLGEAVTEIAASNPGAVIDLLREEDTVVVSAAARIVGRNGITSASGELRELIHHEDAGVRTAAVAAAGVLRSGELAGALVDTLLDPEAEVRIAGARALGALRYRPAAARFREVIESRELRQADRSEKIAVFEAYGSLGDPAAPALLDQILNGKGFLGRREPVELRACAALALGKVGSEVARRSLEKAGAEEDPVVRTAVARALRGGAGEAEG